MRLFDRPPGLSGQFVWLLAAGVGLALLPLVLDPYWTRFAVFVFINIGLASAWNVIGGLAGSVYNSGFAATAGTVGTAVSSTVSAVVGVVPAVFTGVSTAIATASTPVLAGVVVGGVSAYMLRSYSR